MMNPLGPPVSQSSLLKISRTVSAKPSVTIARKSPDKRSDNRATAAPAKAPTSMAAATPPAKGKPSLSVAMPLA